jgi:hypothetical protein
MRRYFTSLGLLGLALACSGGTGGASEGDLLGSDQATNASQQPENSGDVPVSDSQQPSTNSDTATAACVGYTSGAEYIAIVGEIACAQAAACGQPVPSVASMIEQRGEVEDIGYWAELCLAREICAVYPEECANEFDDIPVCPEDVRACMQAAVPLLGCEPTEAQLDQLDQNPPAVCVPLIEAMEAQEGQEQESLPPDDPGEPAPTNDAVPGSAGAGSA